MSNVSLPAGLCTRPATEADVQVIVDINVEFELAELGWSETVPADVNEFWQMEHTDLPTNTCLITTTTGEAIGYTGVAKAKDGIILDVHTGCRPAYQQTSLDTFLLQWAEERGLALLVEDREIPRTISTWSNTPYMSRLLAAQGYRVESSDYRMEIIMHEAPSKPEALEGISIRPFQAGKEEHAVYNVIAEAFPDIDGKPYRPYQEWYARVFEKSASFEPEMLYVADIAGELVGVILCRTYPEEQNGYIWQVAVRRPWRRRGIALQLLRTAFAEYYRRGMTTIQLSVDVQNQAGGLQLYERAGMHKRAQIDTMSKNL